MLQKREYDKSNTIAFRKTTEPFGGLSNMASGYPIEWKFITVKSSEALYQALRYPNNCNIQAEILLQTNAMSAKMISKKYLKHTRDDWEEIKYKIMKLCLELKLISNWDLLHDLFILTENKNIVELVYDDSVWGAKDIGNQYFGENALGRLLMGLREKFIFNPTTAFISPPPIDDVVLLGVDIKELDLIYLRNKAIS